MSIELYARQVDFDQLILDMLTEGLSIEESVAETLQLFNASGYDLSYLFIYENIAEYEVPLMMVMMMTMMIVVIMMIMMMIALWYYCKRAVIVYGWYILVISDW